MRYRVLQAALLVCLGLANTSCRTTNVVFTASGYTPTCRSTTALYQRQSINLDSIVNRASNTSIFCYWSPDRYVRYCGGTWKPLRSTFWYVFEKGLTALGMKVHTTRRPDPRAPTLSLTMRSVTDQRWVFEAKLKHPKGGAFLRQYAINVPPPPPHARTPELLLKRAHCMTDRLVARIFGDPAFQQAFAQGRSPSPAAPGKAPGKAPGPPAAAPGKAPGAAPPPPAPTN